jgi:hypothetical protein
VPSLQKMILKRRGREWKGRKQKKLREEANEKREAKAKKDRERGEATKKEREKERIKNKKVSQ